MGKFFEKLKVVNSYVLGKKNIKQFIKMGANNLDTKKEYRLYLLSNKSQVVTDKDGIIEFFTYYGRLCPDFDSIRYFNLKEVVLDEGAINPIIRGADVMIPGILKYFNKQPNLEIDDIVTVKILNKEVLAIGIVLVNSYQMNENSKGIGIEIIHVRNDNLKNLIK